MFLGDLAKIRGGLILSRKEAKKEQPRYQYESLALKAILPEGIIDRAALGVLPTVDRLNEEYLTQPGDVVVRLSIPYTAVLIDKDTAGLVISSNFVVIRVSEGAILPEYLAWLLNTEEIKRRIMENTGGNMLGSVNARYFQTLEIEPLPIARQKTIAEMNRLAKREVQLLRQLADAKQRYYVQTLRQIERKLRNESHDDER